MPEEDMKTNRRGDENESDNITLMIDPSTTV